MNRDERAARFGTIKTRRLKRAAQRRRPRGGVAFDDQILRYTWTRPTWLKGNPPARLTIELDGYIGSDGNRRFVASNGLQQLVDRAFAVGLAITEKIAPLKPVHVNQYRVMKQCFDWLRARRERVKRQFSSPRDLVLSRKGRLDSVANVLPDGIGWASDQAEDSWDVDRLLTEGRQLAHDRGIKRPSSQTVISFGLLAGARRNPLAADQNELEPLVRSVLFSFEELNLDANADLDLVVFNYLTRLLARYKNHNDESYRNLLFGPQSNLARSVVGSMPKGSKLSEEGVRRSLLRCGWTAHRYVGECIHAAMRTVHNAIDPPLNESEARLFEQFYERQAYLANFPLVLLQDRLRFLQPALFEIWAEPLEENPIRVFHRLLAYYADMVDKRRSADRRIKQQSGGMTHSMTGIEDSASKAATRRRASTNELADLLNGIVLAAIRKRGISCKRDCEDIQAMLRDQDNLPSAPSAVITVDVACERCDWSESIDLTLAELAQAKYEVLP